ncbi:hypothetical protein CCR75_008023 [Bremia lactucae]|uniref:Uncharacterized protein n=1 Tax=Bremia lactucae TaxID=4779 RepID=A0A976FQL8_BRELC|nr:hypothetical protein CCR75_008023 [Bremia lactucae]
MKEMMLESLPDLYEFEQLRGAIKSTVGMAVNWTWKAYAYLLNRPQNGSREEQRPRTHTIRAATC